MILVRLYLCDRDKLSIQTALQDKVLGGPDEHRLSSALRYGPDGTKQLGHLQTTPAQPPTRENNHHFSHHSPNSCMWRQQ